MERSEVCVLPFIFVLFAKSCLAYLPARTDAPVDYGSERVQGVVAVGCDIMSVVTLNTKLLLSVLCYMNAEGPANSEMEKFGRDVVNLKATMFWVTSYKGTWAKMLQQEGYTALPISTMSLGTFWMMANRFESQEDCDCCGTHPTPFEQLQFEDRGDMDALLAGLVDQANQEGAEGVGAIHFSELV